MSKYVWQGLRDPKFWVPIVILFVWGAAFLLDLFVRAFSGVVLSLTFPLLIIWAVVYWVYSRKKQKKLDTLWAKQKAFEERRMKEFREKLQEDPNFSTFCFECIHYRNNRCVLRILNSNAKKVKFEFIAPRRFFCLYWNAPEDEVKV